MTNEPAFPQVKTPGYDGVPMAAFDGLSIRDYFAAKAMQASLAIYARNFDASFMSHVATQAYCLADAMIAERARTNGK